MPQSFFKLDKAWFDGELWIIPGDFEDFAISDSEVLEIYDGGDYIIAAIRNYPFYLHRTNPVYLFGFLCTQYYDYHGNTWR